MVGPEGLEPQPSGYEPPALTIELQALGAGCPALGCRGNGSRGTGSALTQIGKSHKRRAHASVDDAYFVGSHWKLPARTTVIQVTFRMKRAIADGGFEQCRGAHRGG